ncbi:MAG: 50S ribosomal protein L11 methyltransferase [Pyrinomonadaceae bacterium]
MNPEYPQAHLAEHAHRLLKAHETLLRDAERNRKFYNALRKRVADGARVVDIGSGTGVWAIAAAQLGASRVVAIEADKMLVGLIDELAREHGVADRVEAVQASSFDVSLEREFDVVVSETVGYLGYDEHIVEVMIDARRRFLRDFRHRLCRRLGRVATRSARVAKHTTDDELAADGLQARAVERPVSQVRI